MIKALIFDFAGVLAVDGYWVWLNQNVPDIDRHREALFDVSVRADRGEISPDEFMRFVGSRAGTDPDEAQRGWLGKVEINRPMIRLIESLKPSYKIGLLSNYVAQWLDGILETNRLYPLFDATVISSQVKLVKPEPEIFALACSRLGVEPDEAVFVDDRTMHVEGAERFGIRAVLYRSVPSLIGEFRALGVSVPEQECETVG